MVQVLDLYMFFVVFFDWVCVCVWVDGWVILTLNLLSLASLSCRFFSWLEATCAT